MGKKYHAWTQASAGQSKLSFKCHFGLEYEPVNVRSESIRLLVQSVKLHLNCFLQKGRDELKHGICINWFRFTFTQLNYGAALYKESSNIIFHICGEILRLLITSNRRRRDSDYLAFYFRTLLNRTCNFFFN